MLSVASKYVTQSNGEVAVAERWLSRCKEVAVSRGLTVFGFVDTYICVNGINVFLMSRS